MSKKFVIINPDDYHIHPETMEVWADGVSDGYHTMDELYEHRMALNIALFNLIVGADISDYTVVKSKLHHDGTMFEGGYFVVVLLNRSNWEKNQLSYHYKLEHWDKFKIPGVERVPWEYDGHTPQDTITRLLNI